MSHRSLTRSLGYESLESKCMMAADLTAGLFAVDAICDTAATETVAAEMTTCEQEVDWAAPRCGLAEVESNQDVDSVPETAPIGVESTVTEEAATPVAESTVLDLNDGTDGIFGSLGPEEPTQMFDMVAPADGRMNLILASGIADADTRIEVSNADGELMFSSEVPPTTGFHELGFLVSANASVQVEISSDTESAGEFQLTAMFTADEVVTDETPIDDQQSETPDCEPSVAEEETPVELNLDQNLGVVGELEDGSDVDRFLITAPADGELAVSVQEVAEGHEQSLEIKISDLEGRTIAEGLTNDAVSLAATTEADQVLEISIAGPELDSAASWQMAISHTGITEETATDLIGDCIGESATELMVENGVATTTSQLEHDQDQDAFRWTASHDGMTQVNLISLSPNGASDVALSLFDQSGQLIQQASSNRGMEFDFAATAGDSYYLLVDSLNDQPSTYLLNTIATEGLIGAAENVDQDDALATIESDQESENPFADVDAWFDELGQPLLDALV